MLDWAVWFQTVFDVLQSDDEACWSLIRAVGGSASAVIALVDGDTSPTDALAYARTLSELGLVQEAQDILADVMRATLGGAPSARSAAAPVAGWLGELAVVD
ncbi:MAG: hypothetical protein ABMA64_15550 [Myxococcota bacterium]